MNRRDVMKMGLGLATGFAENGRSAWAEQDQRPNILILMCDQLTTSALSCYGGWIPTPNLERLAGKGVTFSNATCTTPFCSPSRASLITGLYPHSHGIVYNVFKVDYPYYVSIGAVPPTEQGITIKDLTTESLLNAAGYATHQYGKWHLSDVGGLTYYPDTYGEFPQYAQDMHSTFQEVRRLPRDQWMDWYGWALPVTTSQAYQKAVEPFLEKSKKRKNWSPSDTDSLVKCGKLNFQSDQIFDYRVAERTIRILRNLGSNPFMITCSLNWPHDPNVAPSPYYDYFDPDQIKLPANFGRLEPRFERELSRTFVTEMGNQAGAGLRELLRIYAGCVRFVDDQVGRVLDAVDTTGRADDTIVVFTADHGDMAGAHGMFWKYTSAFYDEIVRVPLIVSYPRRIKPGRSDIAASLVDIMPTLLGLVGHPIPKEVQGYSLAPYLLGQRDLVSAPAYSFCERVQPNHEHTRRVAPDTPACLMIRGKGWKYVSYPDLVFDYATGTSIFGGEFLYHLDDDPGEMENLATQPAYRVQKELLKHELQAWLKRTNYPKA